MINRQKFYNWWNENRQRWFTHDMSTHQPIIDKEERLLLQQLAEQASGLALPLPAQTTHPLVGETLSVYRGQGLDFDENRPYQNGDNQRLINWRLYARSGQLYSKRFIEERRTPLYLLIDRRANMRFATEGRLKVTMAAQLALCFLFRAQQLGIEVGAWVLEGVDEGNGYAAGRHTDALVEAICAPCPPQPFASEQEAQQAWPTLLQGLHESIPKGSLIIMLSDFAYIDTDMSEALLHQLSHEHEVQALQVLDTLEQQVRLNGRVEMFDEQQGERLSIDGDNAEMVETLQTQLEHQQNRLRALFRDCGITLKSCLCSDDLASVIGVDNVRH